MQLKNVGEFLTAKKHGDSISDVLNNIGDVTKAADALKQIDLDDKFKLLKKYFQSVLSKMSLAITYNQNNCGRFYPPPQFRLNIFLNQLTFVLIKCIPGNPR